MGYFDEAEIFREAAEFEQQEASQSANEADAIVADLTAPSEEELDNEEYMDEVDTRLEVASFYRALLSQELFDNPSTPARIVQREVRAFVRHRLEVLLNIRSERVSAKETAKLPFDEEQLQILTQLSQQLSSEHITGLVLLANRLLGKGGSVVQQKPSANPAVVKTSAAPAVTPAVKPQQAPTAPATKPTKAPVKPVVTPSKAPAPAPKGKPGRKPKEAAAPVPAAPEPAEPAKAEAIDGEKVVVIDPETNKPKAEGKIIIDPNTGEERFLSTNRKQVVPKGGSRLPPPAANMVETTLMSGMVNNVPPGLARIGNMLNGKR